MEEAVKLVGLLPQSAAERCFYGVIESSLWYHATVTEFKNVSARKTWYLQVKYTRIWNLTVPFSISVVLGLGFLNYKTLSWNLQNYMT